MKFGWLTLSLAVGLIIPLQQAMNAKMRTFVVNPMYASLVNFFAARFWESLSPRSCRPVGSPAIGAGD